MIISDYNHEWQTNRVNFILSHYNRDFFKDKRILELGPCNGYIGYLFNQMGAVVHYVEGRQENVDKIQQKFPMNTIECANLDTPDWLWGEWDIIINFGLYYHLEKYHQQHLINCIEHCDLMFFETVIFDSNESIVHFKGEDGFDQSLSGVAGTPSTSYVEDIFIQKNVKFTKYSDPKLNGNQHHYDWQDKNSRIFNGYSRRFWIVETKLD